KTKQRQAILTVFKNASRPLSAREIYDMVKAQHPSVALTTIYRNLDRLTEQQVICKLRVHDNEYSYELNTREHRHYIVCLSCHRTVCIEKCPFEGFAAKVAADTGYEVVSHDIQLYGYCKKCR
ncbi:MAG TPA: transcriptional repressor, partial [Firmicutes bacterium]|nr:transcriptional repressor [Bacillota bacterium]